MTSRQAYICNKYGIHCRPSAIIVKEARQYDGKIRVINSKGRQADARNALGLIGLGILCRETVTIEVEGPDEVSVCDKMVKLFETNFDFQR